LPALGSHMSKYRSLFPSLALIFHLLDRAAGLNEQASIGFMYVQLAAEWCRYLEGHARKLYLAAATSEFDTAREILNHIRSGKVADLFRARDVYLNHWRGLSKPDDVKRGLDVLVDYGWLYAITDNTGGRPRTRFMVHPSIAPAGRDR